MDRLQKLQTEQESVVSELRDHLKTQVIDVVGELISYLRRQDVVEMFSTWDEDKLPENGGSWEVIEAGITKLIQTRLQTVIQEWEEEQQKFAEACRSVFALFFRKYSYLGKELEEIEVKVSQGQAPPREREEGVADQVLKFCDMGNDARRKNIARSYDTVANAIWTISNGSSYTSNITYSASYGVKGYFRKYPEPPPENKVSA